MRNIGSKILAGALLFAATPPLKGMETKVDREFRACLTELLLADGVPLCFEKKKEPHPSSYPNLKENITWGELRKLLSKETEAVNAFLDSQKEFKDNTFKKKFSHGFKMMVETANQGGWYTLEKFSKYLKKGIFFFPKNEERAAWFKKAADHAKKAWIATAYAVATGPAKLFYDNLQQKIKDPTRSEISRKMLQKSFEQYIVFLTYDGEGHEPADGKIHDSVRKASTTTVSSADSTSGEEDARDEKSPLLDPTAVRHRKK